MTKPNIKREYNKAFPFLLVFITFAVQKVKTNE